MHYGDEEFFGEAAELFGGEGVSVWWVWGCGGQWGCGGIAVGRREMGRGRTYWEVC